MSQEPTGARWGAYYRAVRDSPPRETLVRALDRFSPDGAGLAIDLGCGTGADARAMLARGWRVLAIDRQPEALALLCGACPPELLPRLTTQRAAFEGLALPPADLINASFSLPFCRPGRFPDLWARIVAALRPGGRFAGQLFGVRDGWADNPEMTFHARGQVHALLAGFEPEHLHEHEADGATALGETKHWHIFSIVARRLP